MSKFQLEKEIELLNLKIEQLKLEIKDPDRGTEGQVKGPNLMDALQYITDVVFSLDADGKITFVSASAFKSFGYSQDEMIGKLFTQFLPKEEAERVSLLIKDAIKEGWGELFLEYQFMTKSGRLIWIEQNTSLLYSNLGSYKSTAVARDVTEVKRAKGDLLQSEAKYQRIIENMELGLMEVDLEGKITKAYDKFCDLTGYEKNELIGKKATDIFLPPEFYDEMAQQEAKRKKGISEVYEVEMLTKDGERLVVLISGAAIYDSENNIVGSIGIHYNITQRKRNEEELRAAHEATKKARASESAFLRKVSHEIRTPLNAILGLSHLLEYSKLSTEQRGFVRDIKNSSELLRSLMTDVLDVSSIESGLLKVNKEMVNLHDLLEMHQKMFQLNVKKKPIELHLSIGEAVPKTIRTDYNLLNRSLLSIVANAVKFTKEGLITISAEFICEMDSPEVIIKVQDSGIGIDESELQKIFNRFHQAELKEGELSKGTGLGLSIAFSFVGMLGGTIEVESSIGKGSTFSIRLPLEEFCQEINSFDQSDSKISGNGKVLIVEDNDLNRTYCSRLLRNWGVEFKLAEDGQEALDSLEKELFDLILMDVQMPKMDGIQTTLHIRHFLPNENRKTPIIGVSTFAQDSDVQLVLDAGMNDHIGKPYMPDLLLSKLNKWLPTKTVAIEETDQAFEFSPPFDGDHLNRFYGGDIDYACEMFDLFSAGLPKSLANMQASIEQNDFTRLGKACHKIKPTLGMIGMPKFEEAMDRIENKAIANDSASMLESRDMIDDLNQMQKRIENEIVRMKKYIKSTKK